MDWREIRDLKKDYKKLIAFKQEVTPKEDLRSTIEDLKVLFKIAKNKVSKKGRKEAIRILESLEKVKEA